MRLSSMTLCTLTAIAAGAEAVKANENIPLPELPEDSLTTADAKEASLRTNVEEEVLQAQALPPETEEGEFSSPEKSQTEAELLTASTEAAELELEATNEKNSAATELIAEGKQETHYSCDASQAKASKELASNEETQLLAQNFGRRCPRPDRVEPLEAPDFVDSFAASPSLSIYIPVGYGADQNTVFTSHSYQASVREDPGSVYAAGLGVGLGNARESVGAELSYALETSDNFGEGGFNAKLHRRFGNDFSAAVGWNGLLNISRNDFEHSFYGVGTKVFRTRDSLDDLFSRVAVTAGIGDNQYRSVGAVRAGDNNINVFGNVAVRVARPVSFIAEWTGQDLGLGLSIAPFKNVPIVITPALRDVVGAYDQPARFVLGVGTAWRF